MAAQPLGDPASGPAMDLMLAIHRLTRGMRSVLPASAINATQLLVLSQLIGAQPVRIGELAARVHCSQPTATTAVNGLASAGLVHRIKDTEDGRATKVGLTEQGRTALLAFGRREAQVLDQLMARLPDTDRQIMLAAIPIMVRMAEASVGGTVTDEVPADTSDRSRTSGS